MGIRDALTDDYLARFYDPGTLVRARACLDGVLALEAVHETSSSLTVTADVWGTAPTPYAVQFHAEVNETSDWVFSACSCPVARMCKHGAAVALRLRGAPPVPSQPLWQQRLSRLSRRARPAREVHDVRDVPWGWRSPGGRPPAGRGAPPATSPCVPCDRAHARAGRAAGPTGPTSPVPPPPTATCRPQVEALQVLQRGLVSMHAYLVSGSAPLLDDYGDRLVPALRAAVAAGVTLVPGAGVGALSLSSRPARVAADLVRRGSSTELTVIAEVDDRRWRGDLVTPVGRPVTSLVLVEGDDVLLADLAEPLSDALAELLVGPPLVVDPDDHDTFLEALAPLTRHVEVASSDGSLEVPTPPRPHLHLTVTWRSSTHATLAWQWAYGDARCDASSPESLGGVRDPAAERAVLATVAGHLVGLTSASGGDALSLALHDLPHLATLPDVTVTEVEAPDFRESASAPEIAFTLAAQQPDHTDWLDLEVTGQRRRRAGPAARRARGR